MYPNRSSHVSPELMAQKKSFQIASLWFVKKIYVWLLTALLESFTVPQEERKRFFCFFSLLHLCFVTRDQNINVKVFLPAYRVVLALLGKCAVALVFIVMYMWSSELYPTVVRYVFRFGSYLFYKRLVEKGKKKEKWAQRYYNHFCCCYYYYYHYYYYCCSYYYYYYYYYYYKAQVSQQIFTWWMFYVCKFKILFILLPRPI